MVLLHQRTIRHHTSLAVLIIFFNFFFFKVWGWVVASAGCFFTALSMAEICSTYPQAGSVYYWTGQLAPPSWAPFLSFIVGWINFIGNLANSASFASGCVTILAASVTLRDGTVLSTELQVGLSIVLLTLWAAQNCLRIDQQGWMSTVGAGAQVVGSFSVIIAALATRPTTESPNGVFFTSYNGTGIQSFGYISCIGLLMALYCYGGFEAGAHLAEETHNARKVAPRGIVVCIVVSFFTGLFILLGLLYCTPPDSDAQRRGYPSGIALLLSMPCSNMTCGSSAANVTTDSPGSVSGQALINLFWYTTGRQGGFALSIVLAILVYFSGMSAITATSRVAFAMARDKAFPFSKYIYNVNPVTKSPIGTIVLVLILNGLLLLLPLGSTTAFAQITSISSVGYQLSYGIPILLRLTSGRVRFQASWFDLGWLTYPIGWIAVVWCFATAIILMLPQEAPATTENVNYACAIIIGSLLASMYWWISRLGPFFRITNTSNEAPSNEAPSNEAPSNEAPSNEAPSNEVSFNDISVNEISFYEAPSNEAAPSPSNEAPSYEAASNEAPLSNEAPSPSNEAPSPLNEAPSPSNEAPSP
jgi:amino acid transporter